MKIQLLSTVFISTLALSIGNVHASGSYGGSRSYDLPERKVDQTYEVGKSIYTGRRSGSPKLKYCISVENELSPVKRSSLKTYKNDTVQNFTDNLFECDKPDTKIASELSRDEFLYVVYYLNKRYRLNLK